MSKIFKIFIIFITLTTLFICVSNAETTNIYNQVANETESSDEETSNDDLNILEEDSSNSNQTMNLYATTNQNARINTVSSIPEANLGLNNVLCIILIAIGILLILLAIAILIRIKN